MGRLAWRLARWRLGLGRRSPLIGGAVAAATAPYYGGYPYAYGYGYGYPSYAYSGYGYGYPSYAYSGYYPAYSYYRPYRAYRPYGAYAYYRPYVRPYYRRHLYW